MEQELINIYSMWLRNGIIYFNPYYPSVKEWTDSVKQKIEQLKQKIKHEQKDSANGK